MIDSKKHDGDCTIYSSLLNESPTDGICTCGYGLEQKRQCNWDHMYSEEREDCMKMEAHGTTDETKIIANYMANVKDCYDTRRKRFKI